MSLISLPGYRHNTADYICGKRLKICAQSVTTTAVIHHGAMMTVRDYGRSNISEQFMLILEGEVFFLIMDEVVIMTTKLPQTQI